MKIGYARVSTEDQNLDMQLRALEAAGCERIFTDKASGSLEKRRGLSRAVKACQPGDMLMVWKLDRLGRSLRHLITLIDDLRDKSVDLRVLTGQGAMIDTTRADGRMIVGIFAVLAEFERELIRERTKAGMAAAKARGVHVGRPYKLTDKQIARASEWVASGTKTMKATAAHYSVHVVTMRRLIKGHQASWAGADERRG